jgi:hypothetical protein
MVIYYGKNYTDLVTATRGLPIFEDVFKAKTSAEYPHCWPLVETEQIVCKTEDAIRCAPLDAKLIRIGRSVRNSDKGEIIQIELTVAEFLFLMDDLGASSSDRRTT